MSIKSEKELVSQMIDIYCKAHHPKGDVPCLQCEELKEYSAKRLMLCLFGDDKSSCKDCEIHCYRPVERERIREVMRYSGPRLMIKKPFAFIKYMLKKI